MKTLGLIVGSGELDWQLDWQPDGAAETDYGTASMIPLTAELAGVRLIRINRHGVPHRLAPHAINYRANLSALALRSVDAVVALNTVGGIAAGATTGSLLLADQLIDYTWGRAGSFSPDDDVRHIDFSQPYDADLNTALAAAAAATGISLAASGTMAVTQGPRLETVAEIRRLAADGAAMVGMTGMPEAALARELGMPFAALCLVVNAAAGVAGEVLDFYRMREVSSAAMGQAGRLLRTFLERQLQIDQ